MDKLIAEIRGTIAMVMGIFWLLVLAVVLHAAFG